MKLVQVRLEESSRPVPPPHAAAAIALTVAMFVLFAQGRVKVEVVCLVLISLLAIGLYTFPLEGRTPAYGLTVAFAGFGHEALIAICSLMILGRGLVTTGALEPATALLGRLWTYSKELGLLCTLVVCGGISMFINDTPVMVLAMPILLNLASKTGVPASQTLMPLNAAVLLGGMSTTIGTSTNLLVVSIARDLGLPEIGIFDFTPIALMGVAFALPYLWLVMPRLLPSHRPTTIDTPRHFFASLYVEATSVVVDLTLEELKTRIGTDIATGGVSRGSRNFRPHDPAIHLRAGDIVQIEGSAEDIRQASDRTRAPLIHTGTSRGPGGASGDEDVVAEVVVGVGSSLIGATVRSAQIGDRYGASVIGLYRPDRTLFHEQLDLAEETLEIGDVLLIRGDRVRLNELQVAEGAMILEGAAEAPRTALAPAALLIVAAVITAAGLKLVPISIAALAGTIAMIATGCVKFDRVGRALSGEVIVLVAASIALGRALLETGAAAWLGGGLAMLLGPLPAPIALVAVMSFAALMTNFSSNTAAAAVSTPIAVSIAMQLGIPAEAMVLAVLFGCNLAFATPVAYQTNILIMSAGGYQFRDYVRAGLPLVILMVVTLSVLLVLRYGI